MQAIAGSTVTLSLPARRTAAPRASQAAAPLRQAAGLKSAAKAVFGGAQLASLAASSGRNRAQRIQTRRVSASSGRMPRRLGDAAHSVWRARSYKTVTESVYRCRKADSAKRLSL